MSAKTQKKRVSGAKKALYVVLFSVALLLIAASCTGFVLRITDSSETIPDNSRDKAILNAAYEGLVESIALEAEGAKMRELRRLPDFRKMGQNEVNQKVTDAGNEAREEVRKLYSGVDNADTSGIRETITPFEKALNDYNKLRAEEEVVFADVYNELCKSVSDWTSFVGDLADEELYDKIAECVPALKEEAHLKKGILRFARDMSATEKGERIVFKYDYFKESEALSAFGDIADEKYEAVFAELVTIIPELDERSKRTKNDIREKVEEILSATIDGFDENDIVHFDQQADVSHVCGEKYTEFLTTYASVLMIAGVAILFVAMVSIFRSGHDRLKISGGEKA